MADRAASVAVRAERSAHARWRVPAGLRGVRLDVLAVVAAGGAIGALARYGVGLAAPRPPAGFPWATFAINVSGCLLIGVLMVLVTDVSPGHRLLRPFLGTGLLGGFTTFSAQAVEAQQAVTAGAARLAVIYLGGTLLAALGGVWAGSAFTLLVFRAGRAAGRRRESHQR